LRRFVFYVDNAIDFEEFNLFTLTEDDFKVLYLILSKKSIFNEIPLKLKKESVLHEENISKQLYQDYSTFKRKIFENLVQNNPEFDQLTLFKKSQKLLDRFLFILFGEDSGLVPPNAVSKIIDQWKALEELDEAVSLYSRFIKFFHHLDIGHKYKTFEVPAYNGGLFRDDEILNSVKIDDEVLLNDSLKLSSYDFQTEIDVNILGHIFENSLNEIEELTAELEGKAVDKKKTKRKKEGVYYTPKYITKYIVENTIGELCNQKKKDLNLNEIDISLIQGSRTKQGKLNKKANDLLARLKTYSAYLLSLKILDPACGSGAFLNQALEFLIEEHQFVDEYRRQLEKDSLGLFDIKKSILENNIYGVDINEESVEIAKLSLWLRTAERGRKLSDLSANIKCGNSLIDDPEVAGDKAFSWEDEFPEIMGNGGFDAVIGNPPYIRSENLLNIQKEYFNNTYESAFKQYDIYLLFYEKSIQLIKQNGLLFFITPNKFLLADYGLKFREYVLKKFNIFQIVDVSMLNVFPDASVYPVIFGISKRKFSIANEIKINSDVREISKLLPNFLVPVPQKKFIETEDFIINTNIKYLSIIDKFDFETKLLGEIAKITRGFRPPKSTLISNEKLGSNYFPFLKGDSLKSSFNIDWNGEFVNYIKDEIAESKPIDLFTGPKIFIRDIGLKFNACFDDNGFLCLKTIYFVYNLEVLYLKFISIILNSKLLNFYFKVRFSSMHIAGGYLRFRKQFLEKIPIKVVDKNIQKIFAEKADALIVANRNIQKIRKRFHSRLISNLSISKFSNKLYNFYDFDFKIFLSELSKNKIKLSLKEQDEWEDYFNSYKSEINSFQVEILVLENEIDKQVYEIYGLTEEEIEIVENKN
jgi:adenine-specific DNA methylase